MPCKIQVFKSGKNGVKGVLIRGEGGELLCKIPKEFTEGNFDSDADFKRKQKRNRFGQEKGEEEFERDRATLDQDREVAYRDYDETLASSWRNGK